MLGAEELLVVINHQTEDKLRQIITNQGEQSHRTSIRIHYISVLTLIGPSLLFTILAVVVVQFFALNLVL